MHQQDVRSCRRRRRRQRARRRRTAAPAGEDSLDERPHLRLSDVSRHNEQGAGGAQPLRGELGDVVPRDGGIALAGGAASVRIRAIDLLAEDPGGDRRGLGERQSQCRERAGARQRQLAFRERRVLRHVPQQVERQRELIAQRVGRDREKVLARGRREAATHPFDRRRELLGGAARRALGEELGDQLRQAFLAGRVVNPAGAEAQAHGYHGLLVVLHQHELQPAAERRLLERREPNRREQRGAGGLRGEDLGRQMERRNDGKDDNYERGHSFHPSNVPSFHDPHFVLPESAGAAFGRTMTTTEFAGSRYFAAARWMSAADTAR